MELIPQQIYRTLQGYDLTKFDGPIKRDLGIDKNNRQLSEAKNILYRLIGDDQIVWWSQYSPRLFDYLIGSFIHEIYLDPRDILVVIDSFIWNHLIGNSTYIPEEARSELRSKAALSTDDSEISLSQLEDQYLEENLPPKNQLWSKVIKESFTHESDQILTYFPIRFSKFLKIERVTKEMVFN